MNIKLISDQKTYQGSVNKPNFISQKIFDKNFVAVHCSKTVLTWILYFRIVKVINVPISL